MTISFINQSRSYDARRQIVHFWGHDGVMEKVFTVTFDALAKMQRLVGADEASLLNAFDVNRGLIYAAAEKIYARGKLGPYHLNASNF
jgi:hypothetical protein